MPLPHKYTINLKRKMIILNWFIIYHKILLFPQVLDLIILSESDICVLYVLKLI